MEFIDIGMIINIGVRLETWDIGNEAFIGTGSVILRNIPAKTKALVPYNKYSVIFWQKFNSLKLE